MNYACSVYRSIYMCGMALLEKGCTMEQFKDATIKIQTPIQTEIGKIKSKKKFFDGRFEEQMKKFEEMLSELTPLVAFSEETCKTTLEAAMNDPTITKIFTDLIKTCTAYGEVCFLLTKRPDKTEMRTLQRRQDMLLTVSIKLHIKNYKKKLEELCPSAGTTTTVAVPYSKKDMQSKAKMIGFFQRNFPDFYGMIKTFATVCVQNYIRSAMAISILVIIYITTTTRPDDDSSENEHLLWQMAQTAIDWANEHDTPGAAIEDLGTVVGGAIGGAVDGAIDVARPYAVGGYDAAADAARVTMVAINYVAAMLHFMRQRGKVYAVMSGRILN